MELKQKLTLIVAILAVAGCLWWCAFCIRQKRIAPESKVRYLAAMSRLNDAVREGLRDYYHANGRYPDTLTELTVALPDGAEQEMLDSFLYTSRGAFCIVTYGLQWPDEPMRTHKEHAGKGKVLFVEEYVDEQLCSRIEYGDGLQNPETRVEKKYRDERLVSQTVYENGRKVSEETNTRQP